MTKTTLFHATVVAGTLAMLTVAQGAEPSWTIERVDRSANGNRQIGLLVGKDNRVHVAYTGCTDAKCKKDELFYGVRGNDGKWASAVVDGDKGQTGWAVSMLLDPQENLHLFYSNHYKYPTLRHAVRPFGSAADLGAGWKTEVVGKGAGGYWTSAAAAEGAIYVANTSFLNNDVQKSQLQVCTLTRSGWNHETVDATDNAGWFTSTVIGADGQPSVFYTSSGYPDGDLNIATRGTDGKWTIKEIDYHVVKNSVVVDSKGFFHLAYNKMDEKFMKTRDLWYATNSPDGRWHTTLVEGGEFEAQDTGHFPAIKLDAQGGIHIAYNDNFHQKVAYARNLGDGWKIFSITRNKQDGYYAALEIDAKGGVHVAYDSGSELKYAYCPDCAKR